MKEVASQASSNPATSTTMEASPQSRPGQPQRRSDRRRITLSIGTMMGRTYRMGGVWPFDTVLALKARLWEEEGIVMESQELVYREERLRDARTLDSYGIQDGSTLQLVLRMTGGITLQRPKEEQVVVFLCRKEDQVFMIQMDMPNQDKRRQAIEQLLRVNEDGDALFEEVVALGSGPGAFLPPSSSSSSDPSDLRAGGGEGTASLSTSEGSLSSRTGTASPLPSTSSSERPTASACTPRTAASQPSEEVPGEALESTTRTPTSAPAELSPALLSAMLREGADGLVRLGVSQGRVPRTREATNSLLSSLSQGSGPSFTVEGLLAEGVSILELSGASLPPSPLSSSASSAVLDADGGGAEEVEDSCPSRHSNTVGGGEGGKGEGEGHEPHPEGRPPGYPTTPKASVRPATAISLMRLQRGPESMMTFPKSRPASAVLATVEGVALPSLSSMGEARPAPLGPRARGQRAPKDPQAPKRTPRKGTSQGALALPTSGLEESGDALEGAAPASKLQPKRGSTTFLRRAKGAAGGVTRPMPRTIAVPSCPTATVSTTTLERYSSGGSSSSIGGAGPPLTDLAERRIQLSYDEGVAGTCSSWNVQLDPGPPAQSLLPSPCPPALGGTSRMKLGSRGSGGMLNAPKRPVRIGRRPPSATLLLPTVPPDSTTPIATAATTTTTTTTTTAIRYQCTLCHKKLRMATCFTCRCNATFCAVHRYSDRHACPHDYREGGRARLRQENPLLVPDKLARC